MADNKRVLENLRACRERIRRAEAEYNRPANSVQLLAISKNRDAESIAAAVAGDQWRFGEARVQEALPKIDALRSFESADKRIEWHFIGPIQSNKTRAIAENFAWVHSVCRPSIAERLSAQRPEGLEPLNICAQINISGEATKSGVAPDAAEALVRAICDLPRLRLRGLMTIPSRELDREAQRRAYAAFRQLFEPLADAYRLDTLSAGMSEDFEAAIAEGSTMVRVGRGIFGEIPGHVHA